MKDKNCTAILVKINIAETMAITCKTKLSLLTDLMGHYLKCLLI